MDKGQAIQSFWESFDLTAYDENSVPDDAQMPYITYSVSVGAMDDVQLLSASLWYKSQSWAGITQKAEQIAEYIGYNGKYIKLDNGYMYVYQGSPFYQRMSEPGDDTIRRIYININAEFLTAY